MGMTPAWGRPLALIPLLLLAAAGPAGCAGAMSTSGAGFPAAARGAAGSGDLIALTPPGAAAEAVGPARAGSLTGQVMLARATEPALLESASAYKLAGLPAKHALVRLTTVAGGTLLKDGDAILTTTNAKGAFAFPGGIVPGTPCVVEVSLARNHTLQALVLAGATNIVVDEASSMVLSLLRWRKATAGGPLVDVAPQYDNILAMTRQLVAKAGLPSGPDGVPALKVGAEPRLRGEYVRLFADAKTQADDTPESKLSDAWQKVLGVRPLAVNHVGASNASFVWQVGDALADRLPYMADIALDGEGSLYFTGGPLLGIVPGRDLGPLWPGTGSLRAGHLYAAGGQPANGGAPAATMDDAIARASAAVGNPNAAPLGDASFAFGYPVRGLDLEQVQGARPHVYLLFPEIGRVVLVPGGDLVRYGRTLHAGRVYVLAGQGDPLAAEPGAPTVADDPATAFDETAAPLRLGDGGPALDAAVVAPRAIAHDAAGNLFVLEAETIAVPLAGADPRATATAPFANPDARSGLVANQFHGLVRVIRASDGHIFSLRLTQAGSPLSMVGARDLRILHSGQDDWLYVAHSDRHQVVRVKLRDVASLKALEAPQAVETVLGAPDEPGLLAEAVPADPFALALPRAQAGVRLRYPESLDFRADGTMFVGDRNGVWAAQNGRAQLIAGGTAVSELAGDARLVAFPSTSRVRWSEATQDLYVADEVSGRLRRLRLAHPTDK